MASDDRHSRWPYARGFPNGASKVATPTEKDSVLIPKRLPLSIDGQSLAGLARDTADHRVVELRHLQDLGVIIHHLKTFDFCVCQAEQAFCDGTFRIRALDN